MCIRDRPKSVVHVNNMLNRIWRKYPDFKRITPHGFRHTHCSLLFEAGATIKEVQERLGHENIQTTMDIYAHVTQKMCIRDSPVSPFT